MELQPAGGYDAFQIQPMTIPAGVTLLIDPGATVYASLDPRDYDIASGSCAVISSSGNGCKPLITLSHSDGSAIVGGGTINGRGGDTLIGQDFTWWDLARQAQQQHLSQNNPRMIQVSNSSNVILYQVAIVNAPNVHVAAGGVDGFTIWGVTINTPYGSRNTDGIDPGNSRNVTITESSISDGDDNVAIGASNAASSHVTVSNNHFGPGHGMSIGSYTQNGVSHVRVRNLNISGVAGDHNDTGIRIKSDSSRGGLVENIDYANVCMLNVYSPLVFDPFYSSLTGSHIPDYRDIAVHNVHVLTTPDATTQSKLKLEGYDSDHPLGLTLDNVIFDNIPRSSDITSEHARITLGPGPVNLPAISGADVLVDNEVPNDDPPYSCASVFPGLGPVLTVGRSGDYSSIQDAVNALPPTGGTIHINPGIYSEVVRMQTPNVRLVGLGLSPSDVVITYNNSAGTPDGHGGRLGIARSATLSAHGDGFLAENLTIQNTFDMENDQNTTPGAQAVALYVNADKAIFRNVRVIGRWNTLYARSKRCRAETCAPARQYFYGSYLEGNVAFIFGDGAAVFDHCIIQVDRHGHRKETITAQSKRFTNYTSGFVFINSVINADPALRKLYLGRPQRPYSTNVWLNTYMAAPVDPAGWIELKPGITDNLSTSSYAEYRSFGPGSSDNREPYAVQLGACDAQQWEPNAFLNGADDWRPTLIY